MQSGTGQETEYILLERHLYKNQQYYIGLESKKKSPKTKTRRSQNKRI